jgi:ABC-type lipoprotein release transport system permease subunit
VVRDFLFQVEPTDPLVYGAIGVGLLLVTCAASYLPARRAAAVDPVTVLNSE